MPPQVRKADPGTVNSQAPVNIEEPKTTEVDKNATQKEEPPKQDAQTAAKNAEAAKQLAASRNRQNVADEQIVRNKLGQRVPANQSDKGAWGFVKDVARLASDVAGAGVEILSESTAQASKELQKQNSVPMDMFTKKYLEKFTEKKQKEIDLKMESLDENKLAE